MIYLSNPCLKHERESFVFCRSATRLTGSEGLASAGQTQGGRSNIKQGSRSKVLMHEPPIRYEKHLIGFRSCRLCLPQVYALSVMWRGICPDRARFPDQSNSK
jgi:hypothetical protein